MDCLKCGTRMRRTGIEEATEYGIAASFECPNCHNRFQKTVKKGKSPKLPEL